MEYYLCEASLSKSPHFYSQFASLTKSKEDRFVTKRGTSVLSGLYSGKPPCLNFHQTALSAVNDATASPPFSALLMKIYFAEFHQI